MEQLIGRNDGVSAAEMSEISASYRRRSTHCASASDLNGSIARVSKQYVTEVPNRGKYHMNTNGNLLVPGLRA